MGVDAGLLAESFTEFLSRLFHWQEFMPRGSCMRWLPEVVWLHVISDAVIALCYYSIPLGLVYFASKRRDLAFKSLFVMFGIFILACGTTHVMNIIAIWRPPYRLDGVIKAITAFSSLLTAVILWPLIPKALALPSPEQLRQANRELDTAYQAVKESERLKSDFFANVSHELRTPLTLTLAPLESLLAGDYGPVGDRQQQALQIMHNNSVRLLQMVQALLDFSKVEAGKLEVRREPVEIVALTRAIAADFDPMFQQKKLTFRFHADPPRAQVEMDRYLFERMVFNLLANAVKFTPQDGSITVSLRWADGKLRLAVCDTGIGIASADQPKLFQKFRQLEGASSRRFEGTGLGLALVKEFSALLGGDVKVESEFGKGSTFTIECLAPIGSAPEATAAAPADAAGERQARALRRVVPPATSVAPATTLKEGLPRVLIAEDNQELAAYVRDVLAEVCAARLTHDGEQAWQVMQEWQPDLVLVDVMMPTRDGLSLCRQIKSDPKTMFTPVVLLTALTNREAVLKGWEAGADEYLYKPFHPRELLTRVRSILSASQQRKQAQRELATRAEELSTVNQELEAFSYSVSHDLRAPLRSIDGFTQALEEDYTGKFDSTAQQHLRRIHAAAGRMEQLIDGLLNLSRVTRAEMSCEPVDLSAIARSIVAELRQLQPERQMEVVIADDLVTRGDPKLLQVVLQNLLDNAWKFTSKRPRAHMELGRLEKNGRAVYFVRDDGVGFDMAYAQRLFGPFQRLHSEAEFAGHGIGLATVQRIVRRHGGTIWAEAAIDKGAAFYFTLEPERKP